MSPLVPTSSEAIEAKYQTVQNGFYSGKTLSLDYRREQLRNIYYAVLDNEELLKDALVKDLHRSPQETEVLELNEIFAEAHLAIQKLDEWAADVSLGYGDLKNIPAKPHMRKTPYGVVLIQSPWNYPYLCSIVPVIAAIAAGNAVVLKPTEIAPNSSAALQETLEGALDPSIFQIVQGSVAEATLLLEHKWDKIMLTGSCGVGKIVARAAANQLTPVTLELGGKSPVLVTRTANLELTAKRLAWGKFVNAGQTCIAPDYVIVDEEAKDELVRHLQSAIAKLYPNLTKYSDDFAHLVSDRTYQRCVQLIKESRGKVWHYGENPDKSTRFFPPTIVTDVHLEDSLMKEELFLPVLPILSVSDVETSGPAIVHSHDHPLALYIFTGDQKQADRLLAGTRSGAAMVNDCVIQGGSTHVPFGGVGSSGTGRYHGKFGFDEFSYERPVLSQPGWAEIALDSRYPPYRPFNAKLLRFVGRPSPNFPRTGPVRPWFLRRILGSRILKWAALIVLLLWLRAHIRIEFL